MVYLKAGTLNCARLGSLVVPRRPHQNGPPGFAHKNQRAQTCTFKFPGASNTTKIPRENPQETEERMNFPVGERKKSAKFWAPHPAGPHPSGPHLEGPPPLQPQPLQAPTPLRPHPLRALTKTKNWPNRFGASWWRTFHESFGHDVKFDRSCRFNVEGCCPISDFECSVPQSARTPCGESGRSEKSRATSYVAERSQSIDQIQHFGRH